MRFYRGALAVAMAWVAAASSGCSNRQGSSGPGGSNSTVGAIGSSSGNSGSVGLHLNIGASGFTIDALDWTIANGTGSYTGTVHMTNDAGNAAQSIELVAGPILAGGGYTVTLTGNDSNGDPCAGVSPAFAVTAGTSVTALVGVTVTCTVPTDATLAQDVGTGSVAVDAGVVLTNQAPFQCPAVTGVAISPAELHPPEASALGAGVAAGAGGTPTLLWTATCGSGTPVITNPTSANATFVCGTAISTSCTVTLAVGLDGTGADGGSVGPVCTGVANTSLSETIRCESGAIALPACHTGQTQCGTTASDCEDLSHGSGPNGFCGACGAPACTGGDVCTSGTCQPPPPTACTTAPCAASGPNSIGCPGNGNGQGICSATEALLVNLDTTRACYTCMHNNFCIDTATQTGFECGDLAGNLTNGAGNSVLASHACLDTLGCVLGSGAGSANCANSVNGISDCYCGPSLTSTQCTTATTQNGPCLVQEIAGFAYTPGGSAANTILGEFTQQTQPSGNANALAACAAANGCSSCLQGMGTAVDGGGGGGDAGPSDASSDAPGQQAFQCPVVDGIQASTTQLQGALASSTLSALLVPGTGGSQTFLWSATCTTGTPVLGSPTSMSTTFSCGTAVADAGSDFCTVTLTVGLDGPAVEGGPVVPLCVGVPSTSGQLSIQCSAAPPGGACGTGQAQCGIAGASDCETLSDGSGPNHFCGGSCFNAIECASPSVCVSGVCDPNGAGPACTSAPCPVGSKRCVGNGDRTGVCTPTQAELVALDPTMACYNCMQVNFCIDNRSNTGFECQDIAGSFTNGAGASVGALSTCLATLACVTSNAAGGGTACTNNANGISDCYCGPDLTSIQCTAATTQNGPCLSQEIAGFAYTPGSSAANTILGEYTTQTQPSGMANTAADCAAANNCTSCFQ